MTVNYATANGTATAGSDYTAASGALTFPAGSNDAERSRCRCSGDITVEGNETFGVNLSNAVNATLAGSSGTGTIVTDDWPTLSIADVSTAENNNGTFTVTLSAAFPQAVTVNYATANVTATAGADYTATAGTLTFPANTTSQTIIVPAVDDALDENDETYSVVLSGAANAAIAKAIGTGTIVDNDPTPSLAINNVSVVEGDSGTKPAIFTVTLSAPSGRLVTVNYSTANGTATVGSDFSAVSGVLSFPAGTTTQSISVPVLGDIVSEGNEAFVVNLSGAVNATLANGSGTGTIVTDDPKLSINNVSVTEANTGSVAAATFTVSLSAASSQTVTVNYATANGTATAGSDYTPTSGTLTFTPGVTSRTIAVSVLGDMLDENDESFTVTLNSPSNAGLASAVGTANILDNDGTPTVSIGNTTVAEGDSGTSYLVYTVTLSAASGRAVTVNYANSGGDATPGVDFTPTSGTLTFPAGTTSRTIAVPVIGDTTYETNENVLMRLSSPVNATLSIAQGTGGILNDDPKLNIADATVVEGNAGTTNAVFTVTLSATRTVNVTVTYATSNGTATAGSDYTATSGSLTFTPGVTSRTISVPIIGDKTKESNETFIVTLSGPNGAYLGDATATGTIVNDDQ